jgi:hypothetical protein
MEKEDKRALNVQVPETIHFRLRALARKHYDGNMSLLMRKLIDMALEDIEGGKKRLGV